MIFPSSENTTGTLRLRLGDRIESGRCPACGGEEAAHKAQNASLWPMVLGGAQAPDLFGSDKFCNSCVALAENIIDAAFLKSWSMQVELSRSALAFLDPASPSPAPLIYLGRVEDFDSGSDEICERWAGLAGEQIFHILPHVDETFHGYDRKGMHRAQHHRRAGSATLILNSTSQYWSSVAILSFSAYFPHAERYVLDQARPLPQGAPGTIAFEKRHSARQKAYIRGQNGSSLILNAGLSGDAAQRFLIKMALGLGKNIFGRNFGRTASARRLKRRFWMTQTIAPAPLEIPVAAPHIDGVWRLTLGIFSNEFTLKIDTPTGQKLQVLIADEPHLWADLTLESWRETQIFIAIPQREIFVGPIAGSAYGAHMSGAVVLPLLAEIQGLRASARQLPSRIGLG